VRTFSEAWKRKEKITPANTQRRYPTKEQMVPKTEEKAGVVIIRYIHTCI
jgi:hypothetical protein